LVKKHGPYPVDHTEIVPSTLSSGLPSKVIRPLPRDTWERSMSKKNDNYFFLHFWYSSYRFSNASISKQSQTMDATSWISLFFLIFIAVYPVVLAAFANVLEWFFEEWLQF
jgi:hypothetical protein